MNKKDVIKGSVALFKSTKADKMYGTSDGQYFLDQNRAELYKKTKQDPKTGKDSITVYTINASDVAVPDTGSKKSEFLDQGVKKIKAALPTMDDVAVLNSYLAEEKKQDEPRATAVDAIQKRIDELTASNSAE